MSVKRGANGVEWTWTAIQGFSQWVVFHRDEWVAGWVRSPPLASAPLKRSWHRGGVRGNKSACASPPCACCRDQAARSAAVGGGEDAALTCSLLARKAAQRPTFTCNFCSTEALAWTPVEMSSVNHKLHEQASRRQVNKPRAPFIVSCAQRKHVGYPQVRVQSMKAQ